jgi:hypothetical protein
LSRISTTSLEGELRRRREHHRALAQRREAILGELAAVEQDLARLDGMEGPGPRSKAGDGSATGRGGAGSRSVGVKDRGRAVGGRRAKKTTARRAAGKGGAGPGGMTLLDALQKVLRGNTLSLAEMVRAAKAAGYKTTSPNFRNIISQTLLANKDRFKKVARGTYTAR